MNAFGHVGTVSPMHHRRQVVADCCFFYVFIMVFVGVGSGWCSIFFCLYNFAREWDCEVLNVKSTCSMWLLVGHAFGQNLSKLV